MRAPEQALFLAVLYAGRRIGSARARAFFSIRGARAAAAAPVRACRLKAVAATHICTHLSRIFAHPPLSNHNHYIRNQ